jgi:ribosomal protein S18 acetylase RimI-like enzyme
MTITTVVADYHDPHHAQVLIELLDIYARDPMGGGAPLSEHARNNLIAALAQRPEAFSILAFDGATPVGLANCFEGFSTFACKPLVNIHDFMVVPEYRGRQIGTQLLTHVTRIATERGCCKLTLEVLQNNDAARRLYSKFGFAGYTLGSDAGVAQFWQMRLPG